MHKDIVDYVSENNITKVKELLESGISMAKYGNAPLRISTSKGYINIANLLIEYGTIVNVENLTACVTEAIFKGHADIIKLLIDNGANFDFNTKIYGRTPLRYAIWHNNSSMAKVLVDNGAKFNA